MYFDEGLCLNNEVALDPEVPENVGGQKEVAPGAWCKEFEEIPETLKVEKSMKSEFKKFIPFAKVDAAKRQVWGIVTAEVPDKDDEVCDYAKSKPYYQAVITEMSKATDGKNLFPLREMHQLSAVGKCIGFEFRDIDREVFMGFEVVDDEAWKKVDKGVYTGFSHGGRVVGDMVPDEKFEGCMRYTADPSEVSVVDNPCLGVAHFAYVKADGVTELRKLRSEPDNTAGRLKDLEKQVALLKSAKAPTAVSTLITTFRIPVDLDKKEKKKPGVKYLVTDEEYGYLPYTGTDGKPSHRLMGAAWAALHGGYRGKKYSGPDKNGAIARLKAIYEKEGMDTPEKKVAQVRKQVRVWVNRNTNKLVRCVSENKLTAKQVNKRFALDNDLGRLQKGLYDVGRLACFVQELAYMVYNAQFEREQERDETDLPENLAANVESLMDTLLQMAEEETAELKEELAARISV